MASVPLRGAYKSALIVLCISFCPLLVDKSHAGIRRHDRTDDLYTDLADEARFDAAIRVNGPSWVHPADPPGDTRYSLGSGVLIAPDWILTAGHVVISRWEASDPLPSGVIAGDLKDDRLGSFSIIDKFGTQINSVQAFVHADWLSNIGPDVANDPNANGNALNQGRDFALIKLATPLSIAPATRNSTPITASMRENLGVELVGYGSWGHGGEGAVNDGGTRRAGENWFDEFDGPNNNQMLIDLDSPPLPFPDPYPFSTLGSSFPRNLEYIGAPGDSGGPWYATINGQIRVVGITSFASNEQSLNPDNHYGDVAGAGRIDVGGSNGQLINDWINNVMGGVNWNNRITVGYTPFNTASAWGDGRVPDPGDSVQFSLPSLGPPILFPGAYIGITENTTVGNMAVEFGPHNFNTYSNRLTVTGSLYVDDNGELLLSDGNIEAIRLRVGENNVGAFTQSGGDVLVNFHTIVGNAGYGTYHLINGSLRHRQDVPLIVGYGAEGRFIQDGDSVDEDTVEADTIVLGNLAGSCVPNGGACGRYELNGGKVTTVDYLYVGNYGEGEFSQDGGEVHVGSDLSIGVRPGSEGSRYVARGGTATVGGPIIVGRVAGGTGICTGVCRGTLEVTANPVANTSGSIEAASLQIGKESGATGTVIQDAGRVDISGNVDLTLASSTTANYFLSGGELSVGGAINFGPGTATFSFTGGTLHVGTFNGDLDNQGGILAPGNSAGITTIIESYAQRSNGILEIEIGGDEPGVEHDQLRVDDLLSLGGWLKVSLLPGFSPNVDDEFDILNWGSLQGTFSSISLPAPSGLAWDLSQLYTTGILSVVAAALPGDFNNDGTVNAADYVVWRKNNGPQQEYDEWRENFGVIPGGGVFSGDLGSSVPEPMGSLLALFGGCVGSLGSRRRQA